MLRRYFFCPQGSLIAIKFNVLAFPHWFAIWGWSELLQFCDNQKITKENRTLRET